MTPPLKIYRWHPKVWIVSGSFMLLFGVLIFLVNAFWAPFEPRYQEKKLLAWAADISLGEASAPESQKAIGAIRQIGAKAALPVALKLIQAQDSAFHYDLAVWASGWNARHPSFIIPVMYWDEKWRLGENIFRALGTNAAPAIPTLIGLLQGTNPIVAGNASGALGFIGPDAIPFLMKLLPTDNKEAKGLAMVTLAQFGKQSEASLPIILQCLADEKDENVRLRHKAAYALTKISDDSSVIIPVLTNYFQNPTNELFLRAFTVLGNWGSNARPAIPSLIRLIESDHRHGKFPELAALYHIDAVTGKIYLERFEASHTNFRAAAFIDRLLLPQTNPATMPSEYLYPP